MKNVPQMERFKNDKYYLRRVTPESAYGTEGTTAKKMNVLFLAEAQEKR